MNEGPFGPLLAESRHFRWLEKLTLGVRLHH